MAYSIGQTALMLGVSVSSLRRWETDGLLPKSTRSPTGQRRYSENDIKTIEKFIVERR